MLAGDDTAARVHTSYQRTLAPGEVIFDEGDPADRLYVIRSGEVELVRENEARQRAVARLGPGRLLRRARRGARQRRAPRARSRSARLA